jgi:plastocyanin
MRSVVTFVAKPVPTASLAAVIFLGVNSGCSGPLVSGANAPTTVKYRAATKDSATDASSSSTVAAVGEANTAESSGVGTLKGRVEFVGDFAPLPPLFAKGGASKDPSVCGAEVIPNEAIVVKDGGLANAFIYLDKAPKGTVNTAPAEPVVFDQKVCVFIPHALVVRVKQTVRVLNADGAAHNTHTYPKKNTAFNSVVQPNDRGGVDLIYAQAEKEPFSVGCDIHPWMVAYHLPVDHPFAAVSAVDGTFEIKDLPAGKHEFKVWHEAGKMIEKSLVVMIKPGDNNEVTIKVPASKLGK